MARGKTTYLIGALIICIIAILAVTIGLTAGGVVDLFSTTVTFRTGSATYEYDGLPKTLNQWSISKGALKKDTPHKSPSRANRPKSVRAETR